MKWVWYAIEWGTLRLRLWVTHRRRRKVTRSMWTDPYSINTKSIHRALATEWDFLSSCGIQQNPWLLRNTVGRFTKRFLFLTLWRLRNFYSTLSVMQGYRITVPGSIFSRLCRVKVLNFPQVRGWGKFVEQFFSLWCKRVRKMHKGAEFSTLCRVRNSAPFEGWGISLWNGPQVFQTTALPIKRLFIE